MQEKAEAKVRKVQERAEAERKAKAETTKLWHKQQHEREQARILVNSHFPSTTPLPPLTTCLQS